MYILKSSASLPEVVDCAERSLRSLNFAFVQNRTPNLVEFEITQPVYFRIVVEKRSDPQVRNVFLVLPPKISASPGVSIDVRFDLDRDEEHNSVADQNARSFLRNLVSLLPREPWAGLGVREAGKEKKKWKQATS